VQAIASAEIPYPLPPVAVTPIAPHRGLTPHAYGRVVTDNAPVYRHPLEEIAGLPPMRRFEKGYVFVSVLGTVTLNGEKFYRINASEYMHAEDVDDARPSGYTGRFFSTPPGSAVGWLINTVQVSAAPGAAPDPNAPFVGRYQAIQPLSVQRAGEWDWYEIGPGQWVEQRNLALVQPTSPAGPDVIAVDTYEQSMGVYRGGNLIFATLISSGSRAFPTRPGTFKVWAKFTYGRMTGAYFQDRRDFYFLEDVPWILYYDGDRALHGAYWHDNFGIKTSHGCVNLSPRDARWLFDFANIGDTVVVFSSR
jgi:lipoprotein-anchoring transpeptidase ErfK/SrfK